MDRKSAQMVREYAESFERQIYLLEVSGYITDEERDEVCNCLKPLEPYLRKKVV